MSYSHANLFLHSRNVTGVRLIIKLLAQTIFDNVFYAFQFLLEMSLNYADMTIFD